MLQGTVSTAGITRTWTVKSDALARTSSQLLPLPTSLVCLQEARFVWIILVDTDGIFKTVKRETRLLGSERYIVSQEIHLFTPDVSFSPALINLISHQIGC